MAKEENLEKQFEKQMGCMTGFFQIFDRHQIISGKRLCSTKRLPHSKAVDDEDDSEMSSSSTPAISREIVKMRVKDGLENVKSPAAKEVVPPKSPHRLSMFELKGETRCSRKFARETPRLSLDSRAIVDSKGSVHPREIRTDSSILTANRCDSPVSGGGGDTDDKQRRSPSVIARLMGLEQLPESNPENDKAQLRRSASESRAAARDYRSIDNAKSSQFIKQNNQTHSDFVVQSLKAAGVNQTKCQFSVDFSRSGNAMETHSVRNTNGSLEQHKPVNKCLWKSQQHHRKSYFDTADVFPEPKLTMSPYAADIVKKLQVRGIDEASKDLETLKQILEALQFKGLLHSRRTPEHRNFVYDRYLPNECSPKPSGSQYRRTLGNNSPPPKSTLRRNLNEKLSSVSSPRRDRPHIDSNIQTPARHRNSPTHYERRNSNSVVKTTPLSIESPKRQRNESIDSRRTSPVQSPRMRSKPDQSKSPRYKRSTAEKINTTVTEDESSSISESTFSTSSQPDTERSKMEGKSLLERCDKLLYNIADMNATELQPSPVSVLDSSSFYKEDYPSSPSPVLKRSIDFKDISSEFEEEWGYSNSIHQPDESKFDDDDIDTHNQDPDFIYISQILRAFHHFPEDSDVFLIIEKQHYLEGKYNCKASILHRRLIFDIVTEILDRNRKLPPWKAFSYTDSFPKPLLQKIWIELQRIRHQGDNADIFEVICGVLEKDLAADGVSGWEDDPLELSEAVLDIERLVFRDLIGETIREIAVCSWRSPVAVAYRRKLVF